MGKVKVSIIIATYNSDIQKIRCTLKQACKQKGVDYEIIIADDASTERHADKIKDIFEENQFSDYQIVDHNNNVGTVRNLLDAVKNAKGEYVFFTAPGDILVDERVIADFYDFAKNKNAKICFGNYVEYGVVDDEIVFPDRMNRPAIPEVYNKEIKEYKTLFFFGSFITGSVVFREKELTQKSLEYISHTAKYVEDNTTIAYALANNVEIYYYDRKMVWYEVGTGLSTSKSQSWNEIIYEELNKTMCRLKEDYPDDMILDAGYKSYFRRYGVFSKIIILILHPGICLRKIKNSRLPKKRIKHSETDLSNLSGVLETEQ